VFTRILKIVSGIAAVAALGGLIYRFRLWERDWSTIDDGWASLIGSAMGSFLAVIGALYVSKAEERRKKMEFEEFVKVAVQNLALQASYLEAMAREPHKIAPSPETQQSIISIPLRSLTDALAVFEREIANSKDGTYKLRRSIVGLDAMLAETRHLLSLDIQPIHSLHAWHTGAYQVRYHATSFLEAYKWYVPTPSTHHIGETIKEIITTWRSWNIPTNTNAPPSVNIGNSQLHTSQSAHA
jgi:hypothetical protein